MAEGAINPDAINFVLNDLARLIRAEFERRIAAENLPLTPAEARVLAHVARFGRTRHGLLASLGYCCGNRRRAA